MALQFHHRVVHIQHLEHRRQQAIQQYLHRLEHIRHRLISQHHRHEIRTTHQFQVWNQSNNSRLYFSLLFIYFVLQFIIRLAKTTKWVAQSINIVLNNWNSNRFFSSHFVLGRLPLPPTPRPTFPTPVNSIKFIAYQSCCNYFKFYSIVIAKQSTNKSASYAIDTESHNSNTTSSKTANARWCKCSNNRYSFMVNTNSLMNLNQLVLLIWIDWFLFCVGGKL